MNPQLGFDFSDRHVLVGGGSRGIGWATARLMAACGANVSLLGRNSEAGQQALISLSRSANQTHQFIEADHNRLDDLSEKINSLCASNPVHILIHNSGGPAPGPILSEPAEKFLQVFQQHMLAGQILAQAVVPGMQAAGSGRIINVISTSVKAPLPNLGVSNTIRAAVAAWAKTLATELAPYGITVNNVLPGATATERLDGIIQNRAQKTAKDPEIIKEEMLAEIPMRRFARPEETAAAILFLASDMAAYITGINLPVDGGRLSCL